MRKTSFLFVAALVLGCPGCNSPIATKEVHYVHPGEEAVLTSIGQAQERLFMALAKKDAHMLARAVYQRDIARVEQMIRAGKAFELESGTLVKVTAETFNERQVEVLNGAQSGRTGWVPVEWLTPPRTSRH